MFELSRVNYEEVLEQGDSILVRVIASSSYRGFELSGLYCICIYIYMYICIYILNENHWIGSSVGGGGGEVWTLSTGLLYNHHHLLI